MGAFLLVEVHYIYGLLCMSSNMIRNIRPPDLVCVLGSLANAEELECLLPVIERTDFSALPDDCLRRGEGRKLAPERRGRAGD